MADLSFFDEQEDQSLVKARIVEKYFWAWAKVILPTAKRFGNKIAYIDLFAGPGRYKDGAKSTPIKILEAAISDPELQSRLLTLFNDASSENTSSLASEISSLPGIEKLANQPTVRNQEVGSQIVQEFEAVKLVPTLFFVDPWGYKGLSLELINSVVKNWGCDCIFFFNFNRINMGLSNPYVKSHMDALFGEERADELREKISPLSAAERELVVIESLCEALQAMGGDYVLPFRFKNAESNRTSHHLIFVSKHVKGYEIMKEVMAKESSETIQGVSSFEYNPATSAQPFLFELTQPLDELADMLLMSFAGQKITMVDVYNQHHVGKKYIKKNYKNALSQLNDAGKIDVVQKRRKGTFADHIIAEFPEI